MRSGKHLKTGRKRRLWLTVTLSIVASLLVGVVAYGGYLYQKANEAIGNMTVDPGGDLPAPDPLVERPTHKDAPITYLVLGNDSRQGSGGTLNTDVIILASLNPETKSATMVSIPRDMQLKPKGLPARKANYYYAMFYNDNKNTALYETKKMFQDLFQFPIDYAVTINFDGFREIVDELGGLDIDVDMDMRYVDNADGTNIDLRQGFQHLNGKKVLDFVRYRHSNRGTAESSDTERNIRQQVVLKEIMGKMTSFGGITQWGGILDIAGRSIKMDVPESTLRGWITSFTKMKPDTIESIPLEGRWDSPYMIIQEDSLAEALKALRARAGMPAEPTKPLNLVQIASVEPSQKPAGSTSSGTSTLDNGAPRETVRPTATPKPTVKPTVQPTGKPSTQPGESAGEGGGASAQPDATPSPSPSSGPGASDKPVDSTGPDIVVTPSGGGGGGATAPAGGATTPAATPEPSSAATVTPPPAATVQPTPPAVSTAP